MRQSASGLDAASLPPTLCRHPPPWAEILQNSPFSNSYPVKDGTRRKAKPHWKFQSLGPRGKRKYKNIPAALVPRVRKLVENGRRYRKLEKEYSRLVTEESLAALKKTAGEG